MTFTFMLSILPAVAATAILSACGGGGGDAIAVTPAVTPAPAPIDSGASTIVQAITPPTYHLGTEELAAFDLLNAERLRCGFGALAQDAALDQAALAHADWQLLNTTFSHTETVGTNGFTGVTLGDRATAAGYTPLLAVSETLAFGTSPSKIGRGVAGIRELLTAPYHAAALVGPYRDVGISVRSPVDLGMSSAIPVTEVNPGVRTAYQMLASDAVATYPCEGVTGVGFQLTNELPNPVPGRNLYGLPLGHPVSVVVRFGNTLAITSATMVRRSDGKAVILRQPVTAANDPNQHLPINQGFVIPDVPLAPSTAYTVTVSGTNNGAAFSTTFSFATGTTGS